MVTEFYYVERNTTWGCTDKNNLLVFVVKGSAYFEINSKKVLVREKQAFLIPANTPYVRSSFNGEHATFCYVHFHTELPLEEVNENELSLHISNLIESDILYTIEHSDNPHPTQFAYLSNVMSFDDGILDRLDEIKKDDYKSTNPYRLISVSFTLGIILTKFSNDIVKNFNDGNLQKNSAFPIHLQKAIIYIQKNYRKKITTEKLAEVSGVTTQHIIRLFKTHLNVTPLSYVNKFKISCAIEKLRHTNISIKEIAYELGFDNPNYFSRLFKKEVNISPSSRREQIKTFGIIDNKTKQKQE